MSQIIIYPQFLFSSLHKLIKETNLYGFAQLKLIELLKFFYVLLNHKPLNTLKGNKKIISFLSIVNVVQQNSLISD